MLAHGYQPNTYIARKPNPSWDNVVPHGAKVVFRNHASGILDLPLPDQRLIDLHAACCKVAHKSAAAEFFDKHDRDMEEVRMLAYDGSTVALLETALQCISASP
jgi:hypothetical protein